MRPDFPLGNGTRAGRRHLDETADLHDRIAETLTVWIEDRDLYAYWALVDVLNECAQEVHGATRWEDPLEVDPRVHRLRRIIAARLRVHSGTDTALVNYPTRGETSRR